MIYKNMHLPFFCIRFLLIFLGLSTVLLPFLGQAQKESCTCVPSFAPIVEKVLPAVVDISTKVKVPSLAESDFSVQELLSIPDVHSTPLGKMLDQWEEGEREEEMLNKPASLGAGFLIDSEGYIVTNRHIIQDAEEIMVSLYDGQKLPAKIIARDKRTDLALLKINAGKPLPFLTWGNSRKARVGDWVLAVGSPFGFGRSVSAGIISARGRDLSGSSMASVSDGGITSGYVDDLFQTDAAINRGNSGGPMVDTEGHVLGVNVAIFSPSGGSVGIGFSVPASVAAAAIEQMKAKGKVQYGWIGVQVQEITPEAAKILRGSDGMKEDLGGALVTLVTPKGPAAKAGLHPSDIILTFDGHPVTNYEKLPRLVGETSIGKKVPMEILRRGKKISLTVDVIETPQENLSISASSQSEEGQKSTSFSVVGVILSPLSSEEAKRLSLSKGNSAFSIQNIQSFSKALNQPLVVSTPSLEPGDILVEANKTPFHSLEELLSLLRWSSSSERSSASLTVLRGGVSHIISLPADAIFHMETEEEGGALLLIETQKSNGMSSSTKK